MRPMDFGGAEALAAEILAAARPPLRGLYLSVAAACHPDCRKAQTILGSLDELSVLPWLAAAGARTGAERIEALMEAYRANSRYEQRVTEKLRTMLDRKGALPPAANIGTVEVPPPVTRECDEAYLLLRRLYMPDEADAERTEYESAFRRASERERDEKITRFTDAGQPA